MSIERPLVTVVIPCYNSKELVRTLHSVCRQTYPYLEIICVDDGSDIDLLPFVQSLCDSRIVYHRLKQHRNANVARNYGIVHSRGSYVAMLDSDDEWLPTHVADSLRVLDETQADAVYGSLIIRAETDTVVTTRHLREDESMIDFLLSMGLGAQTSTLVMTASSAKDILWDEQLERHQDYDFLVRYSRKYKLTVLDTPTVLYHCSNGARKIDFRSCIRFIRSVEDEITDKIYFSYHRHMLSLALAHHAEEDIIAHYRKELTRYEYLLPLYDYLRILNPHSKYQAWKLKMRYIWNLLNLKVE